MQWSFEDGPLMTRWAKDITPINVLPEYPRPQMVRNEWMNLNGLVQIKACGVNTDSTFSVVTIVRDAGKDIISARGMINERISMTIPEFKLWSPDHPFLYDLEVFLIKGKSTIDKVGSYFGLNNSHSGL